MKTIISVLFAMFISVGVYADEVHPLVLITTDNPKETGEKIDITTDSHFAILGFTITHGVDASKSYALEKLAETDGTVVRKDYALPTVKVRFNLSQHFYHGGRLLISFRIGGLIPKWEEYSFQVMKDNDLKWALFYQSRKVKSIELKFKGKTFVKGIAITTEAE